VGSSIRAYARHRGVSHVAVLQAIKAGRIHKEPDGTIDQAKADLAWNHSTSPRPQESRTPGVRPVTDAALSSIHEILTEEGLPAEGDLTFVQARTAHEIAKAHLARLRLQERRGELVDRTKAAALVFRLAREERDAWLNWPARVAALMAAELGLEAHPMQKALEAQVRAQLSELADVQPDFR
jgi:hypothetical protein